MGNCKKMTEPMDIEAFISAMASKSKPMSDREVTAAEVLADHLDDADLEEEHNVENLKKIMEKMAVKHDTVSLIVLFKYCLRKLFKIINKTCCIEDEKAASKTL